LPAADINDARKLFYAGKYEECRQATSKAIENGEWQEDWRLLQMEAELAVGEHAAALKTLQDALPRYSSSIALRFHRPPRAVAERPTARRGKDVRRN
jgi:hypothetical protein